MLILNDFLGRFFTSDGYPLVFDEKSLFSSFLQNVCTSAHRGILLIYMSYYLDLKYTKLLGGRLLNFKQKRGNVFAFSHSCEDSSKDRVQARGNFYQMDDGMMFHCYHCSSSSSFGNFLRQEDPSLYQEYRMEKFKESKGGLQSTKTREEACGN